MNESKRWKEFNLIIDTLDLDVKEKGLLLIIFRYVNHKTGYANPSRALLKKLYGTNKNDVIDKVINSLIGKGYLYRESGKGVRSKYFIKLGTQIEPSTDIELSSKTELQLGTQIELQLGTQIEPQKENKKKIKENIYSDLDNEDYVNKINEELEEDLFNRIKSNYDPVAIKKELDNLKDKGLSKLDLLKELENNLKIKAIETKKEEPKDVKDIFNYWNSKKIIKHKEITSVIKKEVMKVLKKYSAEEIKQAIDLYSEILKSEFYFSYKWSLSDFLKRSNGISTFMEEGSNKANYEEWKSNNKSNESKEKDIGDLMEQLMANREE